MVTTALEKPHMVMNHESVRFCSTSAKVLEDADQGGQTGSNPVLSK